jgi:hypothetical protein
LTTIEFEALAPYLDDIAFVAEATPASTLAAFAEQLRTAAWRLSNLAGINGAAALTTAAIYLDDASAAPDGVRHILFDLAIDYLTNAKDMVEQFRLLT